MKIIFRYHPGKTKIYISYMEHNVSHVAYIQHIGKLYFSYVMYFTYICKNVIHNSGHDVTYISHMCIATYMYTSVVCIIIHLKITLILLTLNIKYYFFETDNLTIVAALL